ncbi:hypothetical protein MsAg5_06280 [Methanosarcinaceae archaeon Ag5]|uniref:GLUG domain-containing protein n=1 Tax=Methanolapillus africanus TaxID=3028297 RepID=A0AAE4MJH7_9EURY|nr:hypothetical protein [Methanosarcinaceae archaeon Ag5]
MSAQPLGSASIPGSRSGSQKKMKTGVAVLILLFSFLLIVTVLYNPGPVESICSCSLPAGEAPGFEEEQTSSGLPSIVVDPKQGGNPVTPPGPDPEPPGPKFSAELYDYNNTTKTLRLLVSSDQTLTDSDLETVSYAEIGGADVGDFDAGNISIEAYSEPNSFLVSISNGPLTTPGNGRLYNYTVSGTDFNASANYPFESGTGIGADAYQIENIVQFDALRYYTGAAGTGRSFALGGNVTYPEEWNAPVAENPYNRSLSDGNGWLPVGGSATRFSGTIDGNGHELNGFYLNRPAANNVSIFGITNSSSEIKNLTLNNTNIRGQSDVGGLAGTNLGTVSGVRSVSGQISGKAPGGYASVGGLIGNNNAGTVTNSHVVSGTVSGDNWVGGLIGFSNGSVTNSGTENTAVSGRVNVGGLIGSSYFDIQNVSSVNNTVTGTANCIGGLVGANAKNITDSDSKNGTVNGHVSTGGFTGANAGIISNSSAQNMTISTRTDSYIIGGFSGGNTGTITNSSSTDGTMRNISKAGGFVGQNENGGKILSSSSENMTFEGCGGLVGGLVGRNLAGSTIEKSFSTNSINAAGGSNGGLVGDNYGKITESYATGDIKSLGGGERHIGGLVGTAGTNSVIRDCYATGDVDANISETGTFAGGIAGSNYGTIDRVYSTGSVEGYSYVGGISGLSKGTPEKSFGNLTNSISLNSQIEKNPNYGFVSRITVPDAGYAPNNVSNNFGQIEYSWVVDTSQKDGETILPADADLDFYENTLNWNFDAGTGVWTWDDAGNVPVFQWQEEI